MFGMGWVTRFEVNMLLAVCWFLIDKSFWTYLQLYGYLEKSWRFC